METNFNQPQRQSPIGILVIFVDSLQKFARALLPLIFIFLFKASTANKIYVILGILVVLLLVGVVAYLRYLNFTFYIDDKEDEFIVSDGIINKTKTTIQLNKIQQVNIHQNIIQRLIGIYALSVDTAGSDKKEGNIKAISHSLALALKAKLLENETVKPQIQLDDSEPNQLKVEVQKEVHPFLKISLSSLFKVGITSNYVRSIGLILTFFFTLIDNLRNIGKEDVIDGDKIEKMVANYPVIYSILFIIIVMFTIIFLINIGRTIIKYFDYSITKQKGSLLLSYGLINTESTILKPEKVQIVTITRNYFQKKLNVLEIKIKQAISDEKKQRKSLIEIPGCNTTERDEILKLLFSQLPEKGVMMQPNFRKLVFSIFLTIVLPLTGFFIFGNNVDSNILKFTHLAIAFAIFILIIHVFAFRNYRIFINDNHIIKQSGAWDIQNDIIEIKKIQAITTSQLFWHKNLNIGSLTLHTAGGSISFYLGKYDKIREYVNLWLYEIETSDSNWM
ncbi:PH domain-containing protein [Flavobacterium sp. SUN052]|uniref:PH domain-containing protein n=1 Tax=Flavobacterium sp. SUN052 TaxID=3002441 RepID=UPI00237E0108|nr:PH domain-containing protein [Flavobacterium sp. SUN052]MEC4005638.1 PH domain-containing protein [Flavobacterium sp. SUN052]